MTTKFAALISRSHGSMIKTVACVPSVTFQFTLIGQHKESGMMMMITFRDKTTMMMITLLIMSSALPPYPKPKLILLALIFPFPLMIFFLSSQLWFWVSFWLPLHWIAAFISLVRCISSVYCVGRRVLLAGGWRRTRIGVCFEVVLEVASLF